jgi:DNA-directed RNA polymerase subunit E'/Rpb7
VIHELYRQQSDMYTKRSYRIVDRIVSIHQPHICPIVRGKANARVEFGAKVAISLVNGYALMEKLQWDNYKEGVTLKDSVERITSALAIIRKRCLRTSSIVRATIFAIARNTESA